MHHYLGVCACTNTLYVAKLVLLACLLARFRALHRGEEAEAKSNNRCNYKGGGGGQSQWCTSSWLRTIKLLAAPLSHLNSQRSTSSPRLWPLVFCQAAAHNFTQPRQQERNSLKGGCCKTPLMPLGPLIESFRGPPLELISLNGRQEGMGGDPLDPAGWLHPVYSSHV